MTGVKFPAGEVVGIFSVPPPRPDGLWGPLSILFNGLQELLFREVKRPGVKLTTYLHLVPKLIISGTIFSLPNTS